MKKVFKILSISLCLAAFCYVAMPALAFAADDKDLFTTIQGKLITTLQDLRQIVYVIAGFGLMMFAVLAVFNKISYKHLGYIMIGLSLLALMFPFIEYFSGDSDWDTKEQRDVVYGTFINAQKSYKYDPNSHTYQVQGTGSGEITSGTDNYKGGTPDDPSQMSDEEMNAWLKQVEAEADYESQKALNETINDINAHNLKLTDTVKVGDKEVSFRDWSAMQLAGCDTNSTSSKSAWKDGVRNVCTVDQNGGVRVEKEVCQGKVKSDGTCGKTTKQVVTNLYRTAANTVAVAQNIGNTGVGAASILTDSVSAFDQAKSIAGSDMTFLDKVKHIANLTHNTYGATGSVTHDVNSIIGGFIGASQNVGDTAKDWSVNYENNKQGTNATTSLMNAWNQIFRNQQQKVSGVGTAIDKGANVGNTAHNLGQNIDSSVNTFQNMFSKIKGLFGKKK
ncbi:MAG: TrbC/VirB2 family protein [Alphaproteobacteria bacterium]|nr:TrbC/VirB2 family protein [Alphaproteobacteria bacterium]